MTRPVQIRRLNSPEEAAVVFDEILDASFPVDELCRREQFLSMIEHGQLAWVAAGEDGQILGTAICEWDEEPRVMLLAWLAARPGLRGAGIGGQLLDEAMRTWRSEYAPCLALAEVEDPAAHTGSESTGDPVARLRFYGSHGGKALDLPYFQAALRPDTARVNDLLLLVLHADADFAGARPDTIDPGVLRSYLELYQRQCEGQVATDERAMRLWAALDAQPDGVALRPVP